MGDHHSFPRRALLAALPAAPAILALGNKAASAQSGQASQLKGAKVLTAYFTRSGNTKVIAGTIRRARGTDLFEIRPAGGRGCERNPFQTDRLGVTRRQVGRVDGKGHRRTIPAVTWTKRSRRPSRHIGGGSLRPASTHSFISSANKGAKS